MVVISSPSEKMNSLKRVRFLSSEPRLAVILRSTLPKVDEKTLVGTMEEWALGWIEDVGKAMRSRDMMVGTAASIVQTVALGFLARGFSAGLGPSIKRKPFIAEVLARFGGSS